MEHNNWNWQLGQARLRVLLLEAFLQGLVSWVLFGRQAEPAPAWVQRSLPVSLPSKAWALYCQLQFSHERLFFGHGGSRIWVSIFIIR